MSVIHSPIIYGNVICEVVRDKYNLYVETSGGKVDVLYKEMVREPIDLFIEGNQNVAAAIGATKQMVGMGRLFQRKTDVLPTESSVKIDNHIISIPIGNSEYLHTISIGITSNNIYVYLCYPTRDNSQLFSLVTFLYKIKSVEHLNIRNLVIIKDTGHCYILNIKTLVDVFEVVRNIDPSAWGTWFTAEETEYNFDLVSKELCLSIASGWNAETKIDLFAILAAGEWHIT